MHIGLLKETGLETRVALVPRSLKKLQAAGFTVAAESGAGESSGHHDPEYTEEVVIEERAVANGAWLVTGGLGGLGLRGAALLAARGAARLVLTSRSGAVARGGQGLEASLRALGSAAGSTSVVACDGGDASEAAALVALARPAGVLHAAGLLVDRLLQRLAASTVASPFAPKAVGAAHLHASTSMGRVQALLMYSSTASAMGNAGQANYAAANACLDSLARCRGAGGLASSSLQLPLVGGAGMGAAAFDERQMRYRGMAAISLEQYAACLGSVLLRSAGVVGSPLPCGGERLRESVADASQSRFVELVSSSAAVVPAPDDMRLNVPKAYVVLRRGHEPGPEAAKALFAFSRERMAPYMRIRELEFAELPKTISGKIRRVELRAHAAANEQGEFAYSEADFPELKR